MFRAQVLTVRRPKLYYTVSGIITPIGGRPVHRLREDITRYGEWLADISSPAPLGGATSGCCAGQGRSKQYHCDGSKKIAWLLTRIYICYALCYVRQHAVVLNVYLN